MTIFPTHKTELKTDLSKQEVLETLEHNNIYTPGFYYKLKENGTTYTKDELAEISATYTLNPVRKNSGRNLFAPVIDLKIIEKTPHTIVNLSFSSLKSTNLGVLISSILIFIAFAGLAVSDIVNTGFSIGSLIFFPIGLLFYVFCVLMFSFEVRSINKQIEEHINAKPDEPTEKKKFKPRNRYE